MRMSSLSRSCLAVVLAGLAAACVAQRGQKDPGIGRQNDYVGAGVFAATAVGAVALHRTLTGGCYASCPEGYVCNHETGICDRRPCMCPADQVCEVVGGQVLCTQPRRRTEHDLDASKRADASADADADGAPTVPSPP